jgi:hypothetical protein
MRHFLYHSLIISAAEHEAHYVIDGLMHNDVVKSDMSVTKICGGRVDHAANSNAWPSARSGTDAEVP